MDNTEFKITKIRSFEIEWTILNNPVWLDPIRIYLKNR